MSTFNAKPIDELPEASAMQDGCMIPICQDGTAKKLSGTNLKTYAAAAGKEQAASELNRMLVEVIALDKDAEPTITKEIDETTGAIKLIFGIPSGDTKVVNVTAYVTGEAIEFVLSSDNWDSTNYTLKANGYQAEEGSLQIGLPANDDTTNTQCVIESALTIPRFSSVAPDTEDNIAGYVTINISAVNTPTRDVTIAIFGLVEADPVMITQTAIEGVAVPVTGEKRVTAIDNTQFTGTISWSPDDSTFQASTTYTATITLTPKPGYKLAGVAANSFTVAGATSDSNSASSGVVTAVFPTTASEAT